MNVDMMAAYRRSCGWSWLA